MAKKPKPKAAVVPATVATAHPSYSDATAETFREALNALGTSLPEYRDALVGLYEAGQLDDVNAVERVLKGAA